MPMHKKTFDTLPLLSVDNVYDDEQSATNHTFDVAVHGVSMPCTAAGRNNYGRAS